MLVLLAINNIGGFEFLITVIIIGKWHPCCYWNNLEAVGLACLYISIVKFDLPLIQTQWLHNVPNQSLTDLSTMTRRVLYQLPIHAWNFGPREEMTMLGIWCACRISDPLCKQRSLLLCISLDNYLRHWLSTWIFSDYCLGFITFSFVMFSFILTFIVKYMI